MSQSESTLHFITAALRRELSYVTRINESCRTYEKKIAVMGLVTVLVGFALYHRGTTARTAATASAVVQHTRDSLQHTYDSGGERELGVQFLKSQLCCLF